MRPLSLSYRARMLLDEIESQDREARMRTRPDKWTSPADVVRERQLAVIEKALQQAQGGF